jgi:hypothetical protein
MENLNASVYRVKRRLALLMSSCAIPVKGAWQNCGDVTVLSTAPTAAMKITAKFQVSFFFKLTNRKISECEIRNLSSHLAKSTRSAFTPNSPLKSCDPLLLTKAYSLCFGTLLRHLCAHNDVQNLLCHN